MNIKQRNINTGNLRKTAKDRGQSETYENGDLRPREEYDAEEESRQILTTIAKLEQQQQHRHLISYQTYQQFDFFSRKRRRWRRRKEGKRPANFRRTQNGRRLSSISTAWNTKVHYHPCSLPSPSPPPPIWHATEHATPPVSCVNPRASQADFVCQQARSMLHRSQFHIQHK